LGEFRNLLSGGILEKSGESDWYSCASRFGRLPGSSSKPRWVIGGRTSAAINRAAGSTGAAEAAG
jgi:hypothetical protein